MIPSSSSGKLFLTSGVELLEWPLARGDPVPPLLPALEIASPSVGLVQSTELAENDLRELFKGSSR